MSGQPAANSNTFGSKSSYPQHPRVISTNILSHPPSRLSPPPGIGLAEALGPIAGTSSSKPSGTNGAGRPSGPWANSYGSDDGSTVPQTQPESTGGPNVEVNKKKKEDKEGYTPKRGYRACVHCRLRKARCDLGDVNAPSEPPCSRCRREQRDCVFLPSKRRRKTSITEDLEREESQDAPQVEVYPAHASSSGSSAPPQLSTQQSFTSDNSKPVDWNLSSSQPAHRPHIKEETGLPHFRERPKWSHDPSLADYTAGNNKQALLSRSGGPSNFRPNNVHNHSTAPVQYTPQSHPTVTDTTTPGSLGESSVASTSGVSPGHRAKKRRTEPEGTRKIVNASLSNEMDALEILAHAATDGEGDLDGGDSKNNRTHAGDAKRVAWNIGEEDPPPVRALSEFHLIKSGILDESGLHELVDLFFQHHHPALPIFLTARIPRTREQLVDLAHNDAFLLTCIVAVASRHPPDNRFKDVHDRTWAILRDTMADYSFAGLPASIGFVEGVLLLAENLPRETVTPPKDYSVRILAGPGTETAGVHGTDNRRSWALIGLAIRAAYLLGLDQIALEIDEAKRSPNVERARSVWTWCYLYDRTIDKCRLAFWSRGPSLCFVGYSHISQTGEAAGRVNFPLQLSPGAESDETMHDDSASLMQALVELTQIMTNAHDSLYPNKMRTATLVRQGEYFLFLDGYRRALDTHRTVWTPKKWSNLTLKELSWMTYHFVRLYVSSFGYSAHVKRAQWRAEEDSAAGREAARQSIQLFPRGSASSPDALYIFESIGAANEILRSSIRLAQMGSIRYLPSRYLINISYAAVFALKSSYSGAVVGKEMKGIRELVGQVCTALVLACSDKDHPAVRYGQMLRMLSKKLEQLSDASAVPSRFASPEPTSESGPQPNEGSAPPSWVMPTDPFSAPTAHLPSFGGMSFSMPGVGPTMASAYGVDIGIDGVGGGDQNGSVNGGLDFNVNWGIEGLEGDGRPQQEGLFDFDGNYNFDLKGFFDDFTLEGSGFPFR
ncbi:hypothetical protein IAR55_003992 [Kwoniella newhampshirensis]|uniref:Zn(2)-C6 fungal-type domain-containing protein n=1 Tax=Kwoniella newhampshirensis TaxID=1651941 RepID=A0AAW0YY90_9TREE